MARSTIRVKGLRELGRAVKQADKETRTIVRERLRKAAEPVRKESEQEFRRYDERSASGFRVRVWGRGYGVFVEQSKRRTTGQHPEYAQLQMKTLYSSLDSKAREVERELEAAVDELADILD